MKEKMWRLWKTIATVFVLAVVVNYPWELAQAPLYEGMDDFSLALWHCFVASLGDGLLVLLIFGAGRAALRRSDWFVNPGRRGYLVMLAAGLVIGVVVEWAAVHVAGRWTYAPRMPVIPILNIGLAPVAQMLALPPLTFRGVAMSHRGGVRDGESGGDSGEVWRPKKSGGDRVKSSKITACPTPRNQTSINLEPSCSGSARSFGDAYSSEAIQPSPIYTTPYKSPLAGPVTIFTASFFRSPARPSTVFSE